MCTFFATTSCLETDYPLDHWCAACLKAQIQADERAHLAEIDRLRRKLTGVRRKARRAVARARKGVA
jgi:hypothetical protein